MEKIGEANYFENLNRFPELRRKTRKKSIHFSLAIENNQLSLFHYEFIFIHPFSDGNGRTARLWQTVIIAHWKDLLNIFQ